jgi:phosphatidylserine/phosphatidylglycerophosphate/cardiolipin synthase-like enzyme
MTEALFALPAHLRRRLVDALASGAVTVPCSVSSLRSFGIREGAEAVCTSIASLAAMGLSATACAAWIDAVESAAARGTPRPDLVWSGPEVPGLHARDTRRVFEEMLGTAERSIWASTYAYFDGQKAFEVVARRMDEVPGLEVTLLLNIARKRGDTSVTADVVRRFADRLWQQDWPGTARPRVFYDPRALDLDGPSGVLHAKAVVTDDESVFITSANMTEAALDRNIELGVLLKDRAMAGTVTAHFRALIERKLVAVLPSS